MIIDVEEVEVVCSTCQYGGDMKSRLSISIYLTGYMCQGYT